MGKLALGIALVLAAAGCGGPQEQGDAGATCFRDDECAFGLVCAAAGSGERTCTSDVTGLVAIYAPEMPAEPAGGGGTTGGGAPNGGTGAGGGDAGGVVGAGGTEPSAGGNPGAAGTPGGAGAPSTGGNPGAGGTPSGAGAPSTGGSSVEAPDGGAPPAETAGASG